MAGSLLDGGDAIEGAVEAISAATVRHENTRVLVAMNQASDQEPAVRLVFNEMTDAFVTKLGALLARFNLDAGQDRIDLMHALFVGLSVIDLATSRNQGKARNRAALATGFRLLSEAE